MGLKVLIFLYLVAPYNGNMLKKLKQIGPGAMVAAAFIGPGTVTTATIAGSSYGYTLLWAILFSVLATYVLQEMSARLGVIGKMGVGEALRAKLNNKIAKITVAVLVISAIFIGNSAYEAGNITGAVLGFNDTVALFSGLPVNPLILIIGLLAFLLLYSGKYKLIERSLFALVSLMGIIFLVAAISVKPDIGNILKGIFVPSIPEGSLIMIIGLIGTTVVPYNLFLHASSAKERWSGPDDLKNSRWDTVFAVVLGGFITMAILITAAVAFEGKIQLAESASDLSEGLVPLLGNWSTTFIAFGFLAAGFSSSVTAPLAAAYATSEILGWKKDLKGKKFRLIWIVVLVAGLIFAGLGYKPTMVILFSQAANGLLLPVIALFLLWIMNDKKIMGGYANSRLTNSFGIIIILITILLGLKGILSATQLL